MVVWINVCLATSYELILCPLRDGTHGVILERSDGELVNLLMVRQGLAVSQLLEGLLKGNREDDMVSKMLGECSYQLSFYEEFVEIVMSYFSTSEPFQCSVPVVGDRGLLPAALWLLA